MSADILFMCPHNAAKGVIAAEYFNRQAQKAGLEIIADSAGTEPEEAVYPIVVAMLARDGIDVSGYKPRHVTDEELTAARLVVSMGCDAGDLRAAGDKVEYWTTIPLVSQDPEAAREAIDAEVGRLIETLKRGS